MNRILGFHPARLLALILLALLLQACDTELYSGLSEREANRMVATLNRQGIAADRSFEEDGQMRVTVDKAAFADAVDILDRAGLPQQQFENLGDVFQGNGLVSSPMQERARMVYALGQELSNTVSQIDGVRTARVQVVLPDNDLMSGDGRPSSASVFIRHDPSLDVDSLIPRIKTLVANGISDLDYDRVSVVPVAASNDLALEGREGVPMTSFFGVSIAQTSTTAAAWLFGVPVAVALILALALGVFWWRGYRRRPYELTN